MILTLLRGVGFLVLGPLPGGRLYGIAPGALPYLERRDAMHHMSELEQNVLVRLRRRVEYFVRLRRHVERFARLRRQVERDSESNG